MKKNTIAAACAFAIIASPAAAFAQTTTETACRSALDQSVSFPAPKSVTFPAPKSVSFPAPKGIL